MRIIFSIIFLFLGSLIYTQAQNATEGAPARKSSANGVSVTIMGQAKNVDAILQEKFKKGTGSKGKSFKGMRLYSGVRYREISNSTLDIYYEVQPVSKTDPNNSRVSIFLSSGNENFLDSDDYPEEIAAAQDLLEGLELEVNIYEMELAIKDQEKVIQKAIKEHEKMVTDSINLEVKLAETVQAIEENKINRANQLEKIAEEEIRLDDFKMELGRLEEQ